MYQNPNQQALSSDFVPQVMGSKGMQPPSQGYTGGQQAGGRANYMGNPYINQTPSSLSNAPVNPNLQMGQTYTPNNSPPSYGMIAAVEPYGQRPNNMHMGSLNPPQNNPYGQRPNNMHMGSLNPPQNNPYGQQNPLNFLQGFMGQQGAPGMGPQGAPGMGQQGAPGKF